MGGRAGFKTIWFYARRRCRGRPGTLIYDKLQALLTGAGLDAFVEEVCTLYYAPRIGGPSLPPGRYFRIHMAGYFEGIDSERDIGWRCADSYSLRDFLRLAKRNKVPDHSGLSTQSRLPHEAHEKVFGWLLKLVAERGLEQIPFAWNRNSLCLFFAGRNFCGEPVQ